MKLCRRLVGCLGAWLALSATARADVPGDIDGDGDIDFQDFALLIGCSFGPDVAANPSCQEAVDYDFDADVDLADFAAFQRCFSGANQPADANCAAHRAAIEDGCLHVIGTAADSVLALRLRAGASGQLDVDVNNDGAVEFSFARAQFDCIAISARGGDDIVFVDEINGLFTDTETTTIDGGRGDDTLIGGGGGETFIGGPGHDTAALGGGDDLFVWEPGDENDVIDGGGGADTVEVAGSDSAEHFTLTANGARVRFDRITPDAFFLDIGGCEELALSANGGNDSFACTGNLAALIHITADGGPGDDALLGSNGADTLSGGDDNDFVDGQQGNDTALLGAGNDAFQWDPGDGSDTIEGQAGHDTILFNGSAASEIFEFAANGRRLRFTRNIANIVMDTDGVEQFDLRALGSADNVMVSSLADTAVTQVNVDFAGQLGGSAGDAQPDKVTIVGTAAADTFNVAADNGFTLVDLGAAIRVKGYEGGDELVISGVGGDIVNMNGSAAADTMSVTANGTQARADATGMSAGLEVSGALSLTVLGLGGDDHISCTGNLAGLAIPLALDGGPGQDTVLGSNGGDLLIGGDDNDFVDGQQGNDTALLGDGDDTFQWDPGDGSDTVEGQSGSDAIAFNGSAASEIFEFSSNGPRLRFTRNIANIVLDADGVEQFDLRALGAADFININHLPGLALEQVNIELAGTFGGSSGDSQPDTVTVNGASAADTLGVVSGITGVLVTGLPVGVNIRTAESSLDRVTLNGLAGDDTLEAAGLASGVILLTFNGGAGQDQLTGSAGVDTLNGDDEEDTIIGRGGDDIVQMGAGNDLFVWNSGDGNDVIDGGSEADTVAVNGNDAAEQCTVTANGARVRFDRITPAPFFLDIGGCEELLLNANAGNDSLACTGNLAALIHIAAEGGPGEDTLLGSNGADELLGGDDNDFVDGQQGNDVILLGDGNDTSQWDPGDGNDIVEGEEGFDAIVFNGSAISEIYEFSRNGPRLRFTRNIANVVLDADGMEQFDLRALGGADSATVNDLTGTAVSQVNVDLAGTVGGGAGDAQPDAITINGTPAADTIQVTASSGSVSVSGLTALLRIFRSEPAADTLTVNGLGGTDVITAGPGVAGLIALTINQ